MAGSCYCIDLRRASRRLTAIYDEALAPVGVKLAQYSLLRNVARRAPVSLTELGRLTELDRSTVGRNAKVLEKMALVKIGPGRDQREAMLSLTEEGRRVLDESRPLWEEAQQRVESALGAEGASQLRVLLSAL